MIRYAVGQFIMRLTCLRPAADPRSCDWNPPRKMSITVRHGRHAVASENQSELRVAARRGIAPTLRRCKEREESPNIPRIYDESQLTIRLMAVALYFQ